MARLILLTGAVLGLSGVIAGAAFDHALSDKITHAVETALRYQQLYAVLICALGLAVSFGNLPGNTRKHIHAAALLFVAGTIVFCASLYTFALTGNATFAYGAPFGGLTLMAGWITLGALTLTRR
jgi:uncharacterized membrane protein YgdD (TMEM256/DUF423 family)